MKKVIININAILETTSKDTNARKAREKLFQVLHAAGIEFTIEDIYDYVEN